MFFKITVSEHAESSNLQIVKKTCERPMLDTEL